MTSINTVERNTGRSQGAVAATGGRGKGVERESSQSLGSVMDIVQLASKVGARKILSNYDKVRISELVPEQLPARLLEDADKLSQKLEEGRIVDLTEEKELSEDRVFAALVGMRFMQQTGGDIPKRWVGGFNEPSDKEIELAYRRLTQRVSMPAEVENPEYIHNMRVELLDYFREFQGSGKNISAQSETELERNVA